MRYRNEQSTSIYIKERKHSEECSGSVLVGRSCKADATDVKSHSIPGKTKVTSSKKNSNHACIALQLAGLEPF